LGNETQHCVTLRSMRSYKRIRIQGGTYFFTLSLAEWRGGDLLVLQLSALRAAFRQTLDYIHYNPVKHG